MQKPHSSIPEYQLLLHMGGAGLGWGRRPLLRRGRGVGPVPTAVLGRGVEVLPTAAPGRGVGASPAAAPGMGPTPDVVPRRGCRRRLMEGAVDRATAIACGRVVCASVSFHLSDLFHPRAGVAQSQFVWSGSLDLATVGVAKKQKTP
jgi:hypothetical protein